ncbi:MAG: tRNA lysidine(34) synthetase TilS [Candidatus Hydrogenedentota bacterium]|nr:MAG: tRNA lysidine(34) synthetase TilS [Candidatus Hydrogenedentota bacterium]
MCLLVAMAEAAEELGFICRALYVNHLTRPTTGAEYELVFSQCRKLGVPCGYREIERLTKKTTGKTIEEYLREQRYQCLMTEACESGCKTIALGHTADDLVETFLMHLVRGAGAHGLSFERKSKLGTLDLLRPLWATPRTRILTYLQERDVKFVEDESNALLEFTRNRIRHVLLPLLEREFNPRVRETLFRTATQLTQVHAYVEKVALRKLRYYSRLTGDPTRLPAERLQRLPEILQAEIVRLWLQQSCGCVTKPSSRELQQILRMVKGTETRRTMLRGGAMVLSSGGQLIYVSALQDVRPIGSVSGGSLIPQINVELARRWVEKEAQSVLAYLEKPMELSPTPDKPNSYVARVKCLDGKVRRIHVELPKEDAQADGKAALDAATLLYLRNRRPGDRISRSKRLKSLLIEQKIPSYVRDFVVLLVDSKEQLLGIVGFPELTEAITKKSGLVVRIETE